MSKLDELLHSEMTRQQFLVTVGLGAMSLFGLSAIMGILTGNDTEKRPTPTGYGGRSYGN